MLENLSSHILDIAQNSAAAGADRVETVVRLDEDFIGLEISDNGVGMNAAESEAAVNPFYTSRPVRRVGLGLPFLKQSAELCGGKFELSSAPGAGTRVFASFDIRGIDTPPMGDLAGAFLLLMIDAPRVRWLFRCESAGKTIVDLDFTALAEAAGGVGLLRVPELALKFKAVIDVELQSAEFTYSFIKAWKGCGLVAGKET